MVLTCAGCGTSRDVPDRPVGGTPLAQWWESVGKLCSACRAQSPTAPTTPIPMVQIGTYTAVRSARNATIQDRFEDFHAANPWVYDALCKLARDLKARGHSKLGIGMLWEVLRWHYYRATRDPSGATFKLNDHYRSRYARLIEDQEPDLRGSFETRQLQTA